MNNILRTRKWKCDVAKTKIREKYERKIKTAKPCIET